MRFEPPTLRETVAAMDENINHATSNQDSVRNTGTWREPGLPRGFTRIAAPADAKDPAAWILNERRRLRQWFGAEAAHWRRERDYWRRVLDANPGLADEPAHVALGLAAPPDERGLPEPGSAG